MSLPSGPTKSEGGIWPSTVFGADLNKLIALIALCIGGYASFQAYVANEVAGEAVNRQAALKNHITREEFYQQIAALKILIIERTARKP